MRTLTTVLSLGVFSLSLGSGLTWAQSHPVVRITGSTLTATPHERVTFSAKSNGTGPVQFAFRAKGPTGSWKTIGRRGASRDAAFVPGRDGTYWVQALAYPTSGRRKAVWMSPPAVLYVGPNPSLTASQASVAAGQDITLTAHAPSVSNAQYQFWYRPSAGAWVALDPFSSQNRVSVPLTTAGSYQAKVAVRSPHGAFIASVPLALVAYGAPTKIVLKPSRALWVADGAETETLTATVVDSEGAAVGDYNGSGTLTDAAANGAIAQWGPAAGNMTSTMTASPLALTFVNGSATVVLKAGTQAATDDLTASTTVPSGSVITGSTAITASDQVPTAIGLTSSSQYLIANESGNPANYAAEVLDQVGEPMLSGTYQLTATIQGPGQFQDLTQGPDTVTVLGGTGPATVTVYSIAGSLGPVTLTLSAPSLKPATVTMPAILGGQPYQFGVSAAKTVLTQGESTTLTLTQLTKTGGVSDPASLDNSGYVVSITDSNGAQAAGFSLDGAAYTGSPMEFAVAAGPNFFYAVSQPVTLTVSGAAPGTYNIVVSDADGLWKPSKPLTITVVS